MSWLTESNRMNTDTGAFRTTLPTEEFNTSVNQARVSAQRLFSNRSKKMSDIAAERAVREREQRLKYDSEHGKGTYNAKKAQEWTSQLVAKASQPDVVDNLLLIDNTNNNYSFNNMKELIVCQTH